MEHRFQAPPLPGPATWPPDIGVPEVPLTWAQIALGEAGLPARLALTVLRDESGRVLLRWPAGGAGCVLESTGDVASAAWEAVSPAPASEATEYVVPPGQPARFYRMRCP
jgi:hypothetical protein